MSLIANLGHLTTLGPDLAGYGLRWVAYVLTRARGLARAERDPTARCLLRMGFRPPLFQLVHSGQWFGCSLPLGRGWQIHVLFFEDGTLDAHVEADVWHVEHVVGGRLPGAGALRELLASRGLTAPPIRPRAGAAIAGAALTPWLSLRALRRLWQQAPARGEGAARARAVGGPTRLWGPRRLDGWLDDARRPGVGSARR